MASRGSLPSRYAAGSGQHPGRAARTAFRPAEGASAMQHPRRPAAARSRGRVAFAQAAHGRGSTSLAIPRHLCRHQGAAPDRSGTCDDSINACATPPATSRGRRLNAGHFRASGGRTASVRLSVRGCRREQCAVARPRRTGTANSAFWHGLRLRQASSKWRRCGVAAIARVVVVKLTVAPAQYPPAGRTRRRCAKIWLPDHLPSVHAFDPKLADGDEVFVDAINHHAGGTPRRAAAVFLRRPPFRR